MKVSDTLKYSPFSAMDVIKKASQNNPALKKGAKGPGVAILQGGLIDLGYKMPRSTKKNGKPDGIYGSETKNVVIQFQKDEKLPDSDGIAGHDTIIRLDKLLSVKFAKVKPLPKPLKPFIPSDRNYTIGTADPRIAHDRGAGAFNSKNMEISMWALKEAILELLPPRGSSAAILIGRDASFHMLHYLRAIGNDYKINLESMIESGPTAKGRFRHEVNQARKFVERLPVGIHRITSKTAETAYNYKGESTNWYYAVGGYSTWGKGIAKVTQVQKKMAYELQFEYHFYDRYNWDKGKKVKIGPVTVTDEFMGEFHRQGLAKEFNMRAVINRKFTWKQGEAIPNVQYQKSSGR